MGAKFVSNKDETVRMFKNPVLEYLSHIHPLTPIVIYVPIIAYVMYLAVTTTPWLTAVGIFVVGGLIWSFVEYTMHRWVFHYHPKTEIGKKVHFMVHGVHHDYPRDSTRLVMPLLVSVPLAFVFWYLFRATMAPHNYAFFAGFVAGYVLYDTTHYATHHWPMKNKFARFLKEYHMKHHYVDDDTAYSVTLPVWDVLFGTMPQWAQDRLSKNKSK